MVRTIALVVSDTRRTSARKICQPKTIQVAIFPLQTRITPFVRLRIDAFAGGSISLKLKLKFIFKII
jgi:hypothetical protein